jgi:hypothetical protein
MTGTGPVAELLQQRFRVALRRHGLNRQDSGWCLSVDAFRPPAADPRQMLLFD